MPTMTLVPDLIPPEYEAKGGPELDLSTTDNGHLLDPLIRFREGQQTRIDFYSDTERPEQLDRQ